MKLEEVLPHYRRGGKIRCTSWGHGIFIRRSPPMRKRSPLDTVFNDEWEIVEEPKCELCGGTGKLDTVPHKMYTAGIDAFSPRVIDCPKCCK